MLLLLADCFGCMPDWGPDWACLGRERVKPGTGWYGEKGSAAALWVMTLNEQFEHWSLSPPPELVGDPIWKLPAFRIGLFLAPIARDDTDPLASDAHYAHVSDQLLRSVNSIAANITEGYPRHSGRERARFYEFALGSAREARYWYRSLARPLGDEAVWERTFLLTRAIKILTKAIPEERDRNLTPLSRSPNTP